MPDKRLIRMSDVEERRHKYLWEDRIGLGELTVLEGSPGSGKSCITNDLAARVTTGRPMPLCTRRREPAGVVLLQGEDGLANDVKPNLRAAGAGIAKRTLDRAKARLDVRTTKIGGGPGAMWVWATRDGTDRLANRLFSPPTLPRPTRDIVRPTRNRDNERPNDDESRALREFLRGTRDIVRRRRNGDDDHPNDGELQPQ